MCLFTVMFLVYCPEVLKVIQIPWRQWGCELSILLSLILPVETKTFCRKTTVLFLWLKKWHDFCTQTMGSNSPSKVNFWSSVLESLLLKLHQLYFRSKFILQFKTSEALKCEWTFFILVEDYLMHTNKRSAFLVGGNSASQCMTGRIHLDLTD